MSDDGRCPVCRGPNDAVAIVCSGCLDDYRAKKIGPVPMDVVAWAANRAWKFAGAEVDLIRGMARAPKSNGPGESRFSTRKRGRR